MALEREPEPEMVVTIEVVMFGYLFFFLNDGAP